MSVRPEAQRPHGGTFMRTILAAAAKMTLVFLFIPSVAVEAAEVRVLATGALRAILDEMTPQFEQMMGHRLSIKFDFAPALKRQIDAGAKFDVAIVSGEMNDLIEEGKIDAKTRVVLGRTGIGLAVRKGAPKPDISTTDAFRKTLLSSISVAYSGGASGDHFCECSIALASLKA